MKYFGFLLTLFAFLNLHAQEITDYDLQNFARAYKQMSKLNTEAQKDMTKIIAKADLDLEVYHAINDSKNSEFIPDLPQEKFDKYEKIQPEINKIQDQLEKDVEAAYTKNDLDKQKYKSIAERVKQDYILQAKMEKILSHTR